MASSNENFLLREKVKELGTWPESRQDLMCPQLKDRVIFPGALPGFFLSTVLADAYLSMAAQRGA